LSGKVDPGTPQTALIERINLGRMVFGPENISSSPIVIKVQFMLPQRLGERFAGSKDLPIFYALHDRGYAPGIFSAPEAKRTVAGLRRFEIDLQPDIADQGCVTLYCGLWNEDIMMTDIYKFETECPRQSMTENAGPQAQLYGRRCLGGILGLSGRKQSEQRRETGKSVIEKAQHSVSRESANDLDTTRRGFVSIA
jgi:hypothetical protein